MISFKKKKKKEKKIRLEDVLIALIVVSTFFFIRKVFKSFLIIGNEPASLVTGYFGLITAELAILWRLHESRKKREQRDKEKEEELEAQQFDEIDIGYENVSGGQG